MAGLLSGAQPLQSIPLRQLSPPSRTSCSHLISLSATSRRSIHFHNWNHRLLRSLGRNRRASFSSSRENFHHFSPLEKDSKLLDELFISRLCQNLRRIRVLVPPVATPSGLVEALGLGLGRNVLFPVPTVIRLKEPPVVLKCRSGAGCRGGGAAVELGGVGLDWGMVRRMCPWMVAVAHGETTSFNTKQNNVVS